MEKAHALAVDSVKTATRIRQAHLTSLKSQLVRAATSVPTNIVEGTGLTAFIRSNRVLSGQQCTSGELVLD